MAYGLCFRDSIGALLISKFEYLRLSLSVLEAESLGLLHILKMTIPNDLHNVYFETDNKTLVDAFLAHNVPLDEFGDLTSECKCLLYSNPK